MVVHTSHGVVVKAEAGQELPDFLRGPAQRLTKVPSHSDCCAALAENERQTRFVLMDFGCG
jgi:hypothetical protein